MTERTRLPIGHKINYEYHTNRIDLGEKDRIDRWPTKSQTITTETKKIVCKKEDQERRVILSARNPPKFTAWTSRDRIQFTGRWHAPCSLNHEGGEHDGAASILTEERQRTFKPQYVYRGQLPQEGRKEGVGMLVNTSSKQETDDVGAVGRPGIDSGDLVLVLSAWPSVLGQPFPNPYQI
ncbi:hypothetical protein RRG08_063266 [Elysia crispata]|uniref:Uncharacterized protein n=1 Tax=Elysia crispata TaxID=231223 RepID=A0AAE1CK73_9GAST|nr:hypothetical protein RRG08_063266 [Elysia crispata]